MLSRLAGRGATATATAKSRFQCLSSTATPLTVSHVMGESEPALVHDTIYDHFHSRLSSSEQQPCVTSLHQGDSGRLTYGEMDEVSAKLATGLAHIGLRKGDRIAMWSFNNWEWIAMQVATARLGLVLVNLSPAYQKDELAHALRLTGCKAVVTQVGPNSASGGTAFGGH